MTMECPKSRRRSVLTKRSAGAAGGGGVGFSALGSSFRQARMKAAIPVAMRRKRGPIN